MVMPDCSLVVTIFSRHSGPLQRTATRVTSMATFANEEHPVPQLMQGSCQPCCTPCTVACPSACPSCFFAGCHAAGAIVSTAESAAPSPFDRGTKSSRSRRIAVKARCHHPSHDGCVRGNRVGLQDGRRTRQRDRKNRANEFFCHRRQGPNLGERRLAGRHHGC